MSRLSILIKEEIYRYNQLSSEEQDLLYNIFKLSYDKSVGKSWNRNKFDFKSNDSIFYGNKDGFITVRNQNNIYKLMTVAGSLNGIFLGLDELINQNVPIWGMMEDRLARVLVSKYGFIIDKNLSKSIFNIPNLIFGNSRHDINYDGTITIFYDDVGASRKQFVCNRNYLNYLLSLDISKSIKEKIKLLI
jgi:hypothetical protein